MIFHGRKTNACSAFSFCANMMTSSNGTFILFIGPLCGFPGSPVKSLHQGQWRGALMFSLIWTWTKNWVNNRDAGDMRRHSAHDYITITCLFVDNPLTMSTEKARMHLSKLLQAAFELFSMTTCVANNLGNVMLCFVSMKWISRGEDVRCGCVWSSLWYAVLYKLFELWLSHWSLLRAIVSQNIYQDKWKRPSLCLCVSQ